MRRIIHRHTNIFQNRIDSVLLRRRCKSTASKPFGLPPRKSLPKESPRSIVFGSCSSQKDDLSYWSTIIQQDPDLVLLLGDNIYGGDSITSLRQAYTQCAQHDAFREAYTTLPIMATLDDNDYGGDGGGCESNDSSSKEQAKSLFCDFWQIPADDERRRKGRGVYSSYTWGQALQIVMLDSRFHQNEPFRKRQGGDATTKKSQGPFLASDKPSLTFLGESQWLWLQKQFQIPARQRILVSPIQVLAVGHSWDCWNLFPHERARLLQLIQDSTRDDGSTTLILSGDRHFSAFYKQQHHDDDKKHFVEVTSSSLTHSCPEGLLKETDSTRLGDMIFENNFGIIHIAQDSLASGDTSMVVSIRNAQTGELCCHPYNQFKV